MNQVQETDHPEQSPGLDDLDLEVERLRQEIRIRDDLISIAAYELRNPLTTVLATIELALIAAHKAGPTCPPRVSTLLETLQRIVDDYIMRTTKLLDFRRIQSGDLHLDLSSVNLSEVVLSIVQKYKATANSAHTRIETHIEDGIIYVCDRPAVEHIIENLLSNAIKYGMGRPVTIKLRSEGSSAWLDVQDHGIGISPEEQVNIFKRIGEVVPKCRGNGFGIGLFVSSRLISAMDGRLSVSSRLGEGSTFTMVLPIKTH